jgi:hypothetical protein
MVALARHYEVNRSRVMVGGSITYTTGWNNQLHSDGAFTYQYGAEGDVVRRTRIASNPADYRRPGRRALPVRWRGDRFEKWRRPVGWDNRDKSNFEGRQA